jgi:hypothetical protein
MLDGLRLPVYGADDGAALDPVHLAGAEISRRRRERSAGGWRPESVRRRDRVKNPVACAEKIASAKADEANALNARYRP